MKTCCIVDDDDIFRLIFQKGMELSGLPGPIVDFKDGNDALEYFKTVSINSIPEVIFLDVKMYSVSGWDFLTAFQDIKKRFNKEIDIYLISNSFSHKDQSLANESPFITGYFTKPISIGDLKIILK